MYLIIPININPEEYAQELLEMNLWREEEVCFWNIELVFV